MITRIVTFILIAVLALPIATLTPPAETSPSPWGEVAVAAKGKKHKKAKKRKPTTGPNTARQPLTQTFTSTAPITIPGGAPTVEKGPANPYPSTIAVSGFTNGVITDVNLILTDLTHAYPDDLDLLLSAGDGRRAFVLSDVGSRDAVTNFDLTLDDEAAAELPDDAALASGTFRPTNHDSGVVADDAFAAPAPNPDGAVALSTFDGADPNGTWQLWVMDDGINDVGDLGGWALEITAETDVQVPDQVQAKAKQHKQHKHKGKGGKKGKQ